jgi:hypothetical protein
MRDKIKAILESYLEAGINDYEKKTDYFPTNLMQKTREIEELIEEARKEGEREERERQSKLCPCRCHSGSGAMYCVECEYRHEPIFSPKPISTPKE